MTFILSNGKIRPIQRRLWLFECGTCHSEFLCDKNDFFQDRDGAYHLICPVCGHVSDDLDETWVLRGCIKTIKRVRPEPGIVMIPDIVMMNDPVTYNPEKRFTIVDYDGLEYTYDLSNSENSIPEFIEYVGSVEE